MTSRIPSRDEVRALKLHLTLQAVAGGIDTVAALALHLGVCEKSAQRYLLRLEASGAVVSASPVPMRVWRLAPEVQG